MTTTEESAELENLLTLLRESRGFDLGAYKRATLSRRIQKRMQMVGVRDYAEYRDHLEVHPEEFTLLFNTILINVTGFFRDPQNWEALAADGLRPMLERMHDHAPIRAWSAGCASGEEPYTIAMLLAEALGPEAYRERVKIYATDVDDEALAQARQAVYSETQLEDVPPALRTRYFEPQGSGYLFNKDLRRSVIFGHHDLIQDAPISRVDLLVCRNTFMYFNAEAQSRILDRFHFALNDGGLLFLGKAETLLAHGGLFTTTDPKRHLFVKLARVGARDRILPPVASDAPTASGGADDRVRDAAFDASPIAQLVIDRNGMLSRANRQARTLFGLSGRDLGRALQDLELSYRPVELRSLIDRAYAERRNVVLRDVEWNAGSDGAVFDVHVIPLMDSGMAALGVGITFTDTTTRRQVQIQLQHTNQELETTLEELQSSNEELETTNEELQSTNEELETTNEELQSSNEELETMNEELQSTNEELESLNTISQRRSTEVARLNTFLEVILASLRSGVVAVDQDMHVQIWNDRSADLWGLRRDEVEGRNFLNLEIGLPVDKLKRPIRACLNGDSDVERLVVGAVNRLGRSIRLAVTCSRLLSKDADLRGVIMVMDEVREGPDAVDGPGNPGH